MYSLTYEKNGSEAIASVFKKNKIVKDIYISNTKGKDNVDILNKKKLDEDDVFQLFSGIKQGLSLNQIVNSMDIGDDDDNYKELKVGKEYSLFLSPRKDAFNIYIFGPSGSGKSYITCSYINAYHRKFPDNRIFIVLKSNTEDPAYNDGKICEYTEIIVDEEFVDQNLDSDYFENSLVVFDDCDNILDKGNAKYIENLVSELQSNGRKKGVSTINISHAPMMGKKTKSSLTESHIIIGFPGTGNKHITSVLSLYCGASKEQIQKILNLDSRWFAFFRNRPQYVISEKSAFIL